MLFEAFAMALIEEETPVNSVAMTVKKYSNRIWTVFLHWVGGGKRNLNLSDVRRIGVDETSRSKGHSYITHFVDLDTRKTIFVSPGKDANTFRQFTEWLMEHGGLPVTHRSGGNGYVQYLYFRLHEVFAQRTYCV